MLNMLSSQSAFGNKMIGDPGDNSERLDLKPQRSANSGLKCEDFASLYSLHSSEAALSVQGGLRQSLSDHSGGKCIQFVPCFRYSWSASVKNAQVKRALLKSSTTQSTWFKGTAGADDWIFSLDFSMPHLFLFSSALFKRIYICRVAQMAIQFEWLDWIRYFFFFFNTGG